MNLFMQRHMRVECRMGDIHTKTPTMGEYTNYHILILDADIAPIAANDAPEVNLLDSLDPSDPFDPLPHRLK